MRRLLPILSLITLVLFGTATIHCMVEAAGEGSESTCCVVECTGGSQSGSVGCGSVAKAESKPAAGPTKLASPVWLAGTRFLMADPPAIAMTLAELLDPRPPAERPQDWVSSRHFARRTVLPSRAPSSTPA